jgi:hypothetical protein
MHPAMLPRGKPQGPQRTIVRLVSISNLFLSNTVLCILGKSLRLCRTFLVFLFSLAKR